MDECLDFPIPSGHYQWMDIVMHQNFLENLLAMYDRWIKWTRLEPYTWSQFINDKSHLPKLILLSQSTFQAQQWGSLEDTKQPQKLSSCLILDITPWTKVILCKFFINIPYLYEDHIQSLSYFLVCRLSCFWHPVHGRIVFRTAFWPYVYFFFLNQILRIFA